MRTPLCDICLKSGILCPGCQDKVSRGDISELDIAISTRLFELVSHHDIPDSFTFIRSMETDGIIIIFVGHNNIGMLVGKGGRIIRSLQKMFGKKIRVLEDTKDMQKTLSDLIYPVRISGVNTLHLPDGTLKKKVRINCHDEKRLPLNIKSAKNIIATITGEQIDIVFE